ncbi:MAG: leucine-rich repeat domain-containing protein [Promethearchaeota archaeon]
MGRSRYYQKVHGFDPEKDRLYNLEGTEYKYEQSFPLEKDIAFHNSGVEIVARVEVKQDGRVRNRIVFRRGEQETSVTCVHTAVFEMTPSDALALEGDPRELIELARSTELRPVELPPEEHFASLKSYVAGIAELGVVNLLNASYASREVNPETLPFGFNAELHKQVVHALRTLVPGVTRAMIRDLVIQLAYTVASDWFDSRVQLLDDLYDFVDVVATEPETFELVDSLVESEKLRMLCARFPRAHPEVLSKLARDPNWITRNLVAKNPALGREAAQVLSRDADWRVRKELALNPATPRGILRALASDGNQQVRIWVQANPGVTPDILDALARDPSSDEQVLLLVAQHLKVSEGTLEYLSTHGTTDVKVRASEHPRVTQRVLEVLANDPAPTVRCAVAQNPDCPQGLLRRLAGDPEFAVKQLVHAHPGVDVQALETLARDGDYRARVLVLRNVKVTPGILDQLVSDIDYYVRWSARSHPGTSDGSRERSARLDSLDPSTPVIFKGEFVSKAEADALILVEYHAGVELFPPANAAGRPARFFTRSGVVSGLEITGTPARNLPDVFEAFRYLETLVLRGTSITSLPLSVTRLRHLRELDIGENSIKALPPEIGELARLEVLSAGNNELESLPDTVGKLVELKLLDVSGNRLAKLPDGRLDNEHLQNLLLHDNPLSEFPSLPKGVYAGFLRRWAKIPIPMGEKEALADLSILFGEAINVLTGDPAGFDSPFTPPFFKAVHFGGHVTQLRLHGARKIPVLPPSVGNFEHLEVFDASDNDLSCLPETARNWRYLQELDLRENQLRAFPGVLAGREISRTLRELRLQKNMITEIPPSVTSLTKLEELNLSENPISISSLSEGVLRGLRALKANGCSIYPSWLAL